MSTVPGVVPVVASLGFPSRKYEYCFAPNVGSTNQSSNRHPSTALRMRSSKGRHLSLNMSKLAISWEHQCTLCRIRSRSNVMAAFLLWCILFVLCWPVAILALIAYPFVWLLVLPFRILGLAVHGVLALVWAVVMLPVRLLSAPFRLASETRQLHCG